MAYQQKTRITGEQPDALIDKIENPGRRVDARRLLALFAAVTGLEARMWGEGMVGFGSYHYRYASGHEGDAMIVGFAPRKAKISLYLAAYFPEREQLLAELGKHTEGVGCVYVNKLADIRLDVLEELIGRSVAFIRETYPDPQQDRS
ncbi:MAG: DUF1801 domain-containing protein [Clostridiaceae bacterium]|nr:DUF1801 domain-containing protein [Clostridiaceae bacterium]